MSDGYDQKFFEDNAPIALSSAEIILPGVVNDTNAYTVIDIGCSQGAWLSVADSIGCEVHGVDGYVPSGNLMIDPSQFERQDLTNGYDCTGYDLAICLEVAEHLPESSARALVEGLCKAKFVLFSAAHPGQGGVNHINEQWTTWWAKLFTEHGYTSSCDLRVRHWDDERVMDFYRENITVYGTWENLRAAGYWDWVRNHIHPMRPGAEFYGDDLKVVD